MQTHTSDSSSEFEAVESDGVLRLTIQRESRRNAINPAVMTGLAEALSQANANRSLRAIVLTGAGDIRYAELAGVPEDRRVLFPDFTAALAGLQADRVDAVVASSITIQNALKRLGDPEIEYAELTEQPRGEDGNPVVSYGGMGFRKEDSALRDSWNEWLAGQLASGRATEIMQPFGFGRETLPPADVTADQICGEPQ